MILRFVQYNDTILENPIEIDIITVSARIENGVIYDSNDAVRLGLEIDPLIFSTDNTTDFSLFPSGTYYMTNGNYMKVTLYEHSANISFYWGYKWGDFNKNNIMVWSYNLPVSNPTFVRLGFGARGNEFGFIIECGTNNTALYPSGSLMKYSNRFVGPRSPYGTYDKTPTYTDFIQFFGGSVETQEPSTENGGLGADDNHSDNVSLPSLPQTSALQSNMIKMYAPSPTQLQQFSNYLWSNNIFDNLPKLFKDPMEAILSLSIIPVPFQVSNIENIVLGNLNTNVSAYTINEQFCEIDFGDINFRELWGSYLDYAPNTKIEIYLPYISYQPLDVNTIMDSICQLKYRVDLLTGVCIAYLKVKKDNLNSIIYTWSGNCAITIPLSASNQTQKIASIVGAASSVAMGGALVSASGGSASAMLPVLVGGVTSTLTGTKEHTQKVGGGQMETSYLGVQRPYVIITRPDISLPVDYEKFNGYPSNITDIIGNVTGYCEIENIHLENIPATADELDELEQILTTGFII